MFKSNDWYFCLVGEVSQENRSVEIVPTLHKPELICRYQSPTVALTDIQKRLTADPRKEAMVILDVEMTGMTVWEMVGALNDWETYITARMKIYVLLRRNDWEGMIKVYIEPLVAGYLEKPLTARDYEDMILKPGFSAHGDV